MSYKKALCDKLAYFYTLLNRNFTTEQHRKAYQKYEMTVLYYKSQIYQCLVLVYEIVCWSSGWARFTVAKEFLEGKG